jgi:twitching motility two-component system response regulator PilH
LARKILLADDSVTAQNMGRKILTDAGYEVVTVNNGSAALKKIAECKPTVVVLDVYMPGYSGLEVCARIKEGRDTEGIPVLLTVGKLEPFRQEEARKVHADAFIIKPFEATELLAALSKLEPKAVSQPESKSADQPKAATESKSTKHVAPTMARYEREVADGAPRFGDQESGWKARLTMPSPESRHREPEQEPEIATISGQPAPQFDHDPGDHPAFAVTPAPATLDSPNAVPGLPGDVTSDELAAIAAAAAAVGGSNGDKDFEPPAQQEPTSSREPDSRDAAPVTFASESAPAHAQTSYESTSSSAGPVSAQVEAVFTSFAAANPAAAAMAAAKPASAPERASAASDSASLAVGTRWVAEEVPLEPAESALVLEREMQKAFAAFAAAEHAGSYEPGRVDESDEPMFASIAPPAIGAATPFTESTQAASEPQPTAEPAVAMAAPASVSASEPSISSEISKPPAAPFTPVVAAEATHAVVAFGEPHPFGAVEAVPAAAPAAEVQAQSETSDAQAFEAGVNAPPDDWHELRHPVALSPASSGNGSATFEDFNSSQEAVETSVPESAPEAAAMAAAASGDSSSSSSNDANLSSIVDNMLAELKPKLMAELAKKLEKK